MLLPLLDREEPVFLILLRLLRPSKVDQSDGRTRSDHSVLHDPWDPLALPFWPLPSRFRELVTPSPVPAVLVPTALELVLNKFSLERAILLSAELVSFYLFIFIIISVG